MSRSEIHLRPAIRAGMLVFALLIHTATTPTSAMAQPAVEGKWSAVFDTPNAMIHASVLPSGKVLFWGRREAGQKINPDPPHDCQPLIWNAPATGPAAFSPTANTPGYNLFCSGHTILADGRVFVVGGHIDDGKGEQFATIYNPDPADNKWHRIQPTSGGRWYPTALTLPDGSVLVSFGTDKDGHNNNSQQVWKNGVWRDIVNFRSPPYYPRMHVISNGHVFMSGPLPATQFLDTSFDDNRRPTSWTLLHADPDINKANALSSRRSGLLQEYGPSVLYDANKIVYIGGGKPPLSDVEILDLNAAAPSWSNTDPMHLPRRQHNATLLPDGTILVMGGTQGQGAKIPGEEKGFNDLTIGAPIHSAELWDPRTGHWTKLAKADVDRCYHSTAFLLPDATVVSAGGGEFSPKRMGDQNLPEDTHKNAQIFSPPYLFRGARPVITNAPTDVTYGQVFDVGTANPNLIGAVNWIRLSSVTHSNNMNQRINFLTFTPGGGSVKVTAPANANLCPPGHYMLFILDMNKVPSVAQIVKIH